MATSAVLAKIQAAADPLMPEGTTWKVGEENIANEDAPPRVVFAYGPDDDFAAARATREARPVNPRPLLTRVAKFQAHIWGRDHDQVEEMLGTLVGALYGLALGSMTIISGSWIRPAVTAAGRAYVLAFSLDVPVFSLPGGVGTATSIPQDVGMRT